MNEKLLTALLATALICGGCGSDDNDDKDDGGNITPPPVADTIDAGEALAINLTLAEFDGATGALNFALKDADGLAITNAKDYRIVYFGFPDSTTASSNAKAWKHWHVTQSYLCDSAEGDCQGVLTETDKGQYSFEATDLNWDANTAPGSVKEYKVGIEIKGAKATNELVLLPST
ncbi:hypothetical protein [Shewanella sp. cp20]|uniref:hypothetical protein n=1 Tax=Shewanella sp. cp20 TaxID=1521167 RepID=UPI0005A20928|nr:hypothetical protein [Shewanella sp. cp20]KIO38227.1 hypothetical protein DB48_01385 [Shewanella sp. cp20]